jgi:hypothetical protein
VPQDVDFTMEWLILEVIAALAAAGAIVWWTTRASRAKDRGHRDDERR